MESEKYIIHPIARIENNYREKFGIPRQGGLVDSVISRIVFFPEYRSRESVRGLEEYDYIWILWMFSRVRMDEWSPTVRPPKLGGNRRMGVYATRSPYRPNHIGLSCVRLLRMDFEEKEAPVLYVSGADILDGTPVVDIKPYLPYADARPGARGGFTDTLDCPKLEVCFEEAKIKMDPELMNTLREVLAQDPRPSYQEDPKRIYGMRFGNMDVKFRIDGRRVMVTDCVYFDD